MVAPTEERLPKDFGKYRLVRRIATGGMAEIFLAHRLDAPDQPLVVKRILPHLAESADFVSMFLDEARIAAQLDHPNIVRINDVGQIAGAYYIAMEYIHGEDVRRIYNQAYKLQRSLPLSHSIRVIAEAALGLDFAHRLPDLAGRPMGVVHRDVSPQNILVTYDGRVKVVDFGIAKAANKVNQTRAGVLKGKYSYMSPEQATGDGIDHRTDIFALGIILYETTTGTRLFKRQTEIATLQAVMRCEVTPPSQALEGYPPELEDVVLRALAKRPQDRYQSGLELSDDLYYFLKSSGLYVEPLAIAEFMADLFADRLEEERASGLPALPEEEEVRAEMQQERAAVEVLPVEEQDALAPPTASGASAPAPDDTALSPQAQATFADDPRASESVEQRPGFLDDDEQSLDDGTVPEEDREDLSLPVAAPKSRRPEADQLPTVVHHPVYRDSGKIPKGPEADAAMEPRVVEATEFVRVPPPTRPEPENKTEPKPRSERPRANGTPAGVRAQPSRRPLPPPQQSTRPGILLLAIFVFGLAAALVVARATGAWSFGRNAPVEGEAASSAEGRFGEVHVATEPLAEVWHGGQPIARADDAGQAGPIRLPEGLQVLKVVLPDRGFERERPVHIRAGGIHEIEIRAQKGWLKVAVAPWGRVAIDGRDRGVTPLSNLLLEEGIHQIQVDNPEIKRRHVARIRVQPGEVAEVKIDLAVSGVPY